MLRSNHPGPSAEAGVQHHPGAGPQQVGETAGQRVDGVVLQAFPANGTAELAIQVLSDRLGSLGLQALSATPARPARGRRVSSGASLQASLKLARCAGVISLEADRRPWLPGLSWAAASSRSSSKGRSSSTRRWHLAPRLRRPCASASPERGLARRPWRAPLRPARGPRRGVGRPVDANMNEFVGGPPAAGRPRAGAHAGAHPAGDGALSRHDDLREHLPHRAHRQDDLSHHRRDGCRSPRQRRGPDRRRGPRGDARAGRVPGWRSAWACSLRRAHAAGGAAACPHARGGSLRAGDVLDTVQAGFQGTQVAQIVNGSACERSSCSCASRRAFRAILVTQFGPS